MTEKDLTCDCGEERHYFKNEGWKCPHCQPQYFNQEVWVIERLIKVLKEILPEFKTLNDKHIPLICKKSNVKEVAEVTNGKAICNQILDFRIAHRDGVLSTAWGHMKVKKGDYIIYAAPDYYSYVLPKKIFESLFNIREAESENHFDILEAE